MPRKTEILPEELSHSTLFDQSNPTDMFAEPPDGQLDPQFVQQAFKKILEKQRENYQKHPGRFPVRIQRLWDAIRGRENDILSISELMIQFSDTKNPSTSTREAISYLNRLFAEENIDLEIKHVTAYRVSRRSNKR